MAYDFVMPPTTGPLQLRREARMLMGEAIERMSAETGYRFGPRGWAYYAEGLLKGLDWYDPEFEVVNVGLTEAQIDRLGLMKIDNLETGGGRDLSDPSHPDHFKRYVQDYISRFGVWKCEANALVGHPPEARALLEDAINRFIPASHPGDVETNNRPAQAAVRSEISRLMQGWTFED